MEVMRENRGRAYILETLKEVPTLVSEVMREETSLSVLSGNGIYATFLKVLTDLSFPADEAKYHYDAICDWKDALEQDLGREVSFTVALLDYFSSEHNLLTNPKIIGFKRYETERQNALLDTLTGLYNRRFADDYLKREISRSLRYGFSCSLLFIDIDNFKMINDSYGHQAGDKVLSDFSKIIKETIRLEDSAIRFGGEEFIVVMPETDVNGAKKTAERISAGVKTHLFSHNKEVTFSAGISVYPGHGDTAEKLILAADTALYQAKFSGKNRIVCPPMEKRFATRYPLNWDLLLTDEAKNNHILPAKNISVKGAAVESERAFSIGDKLNLTLIGSDSKKIENIRGNVVWVRQLSARNMFRLGIKFSSLDNENARVLDKLLTVDAPRN